jgi:hypothetical protein
VEGYKEYHFSLIETHNASETGGKPPADSTQKVIIREYISSTMYLGMASWAAVGMLQDLVFLVINIRFRTAR